MTHPPLVVPVFISHAGCPHRCVFCNQGVITDQAPAPPTAQAIQTALDTYLGDRSNHCREVQISFYGGNFLGLSPATRQRLLSAANTHVRAGRVNTLRFSTRPDTVTEKSLAAIAPYPVTTVEIGVQSMDDAVLRQARRGHDSESSRSAVAELKRNGYRVGVQVMVGLPGEDDLSLSRTAAAVAGMAPDFVRIYPALVLPGSALDNWCQTGRYTPLSLKQAVERTKRMLSFFYSRHIPVVRMGLQPTDGLSAAAARGEVLGPYHPAFGHLVQQSLYYDAARALMAEVEASTSAVIRVHPRRISVMRGLGNENVKRLKARYRLQRVDVVGDNDLALDWVSVGNRAINAFTKRV